MAAAASRWAAILAARPELAPAVALQQQLIALVVDLTETVEHARLPRLSLPPRYLAAKLTRGIPAFATEPIPLPVPALAPALLSLCDELARGGAGETAEHIRVRDRRVADGRRVASHRLVHPRPGRDSHRRHSSQPVARSRLARG